MKKSLAIATAAALLALAGCTTPFNAKVSRFQALPAPNGQTFAIQSSDPRLQGGIEFGEYARIVSAKMVQQGYQPASNASRADLVVDMRYSIDHGHEKVVSTPGFGPYGGPFGFYGRRRFAYGFYDPFLFDDGFGDVRSYTVYTSELDLQIDRTDNGQRVFEGTAKAHSRDDSLPHVVPELIEAMFTGFPGNSGETVRITVEPERR